MKKELFAGVLLLVLIGLCAWNLRYLSRMCTQLVILCFFAHFSA